MEIRFILNFKNKRLGSTEIYRNVFSEEMLLLLAKIMFHRLEDEVEQLIEREEKNSDYTIENYLDIEKIEN